MRYLFFVSRRVTPTVARELVQQVFEERGGEIVETIAQQLTQQGVELGRIESLVQIVIALPGHRFGELPPTIETRVKRLDETQL